jgi:acetoin utilization protein AcuC
VERAALIWDRALAAYDLGPAHPLDPLRLLLTVDLMEAYGLLGQGTVIAPRMATDDELALVHSRGYIEAVRESSDWGTGLHASMGLGGEDNPIYPGMHDVAALVCGASIAAIQEVLAGRRERTFSIASGMHHAHRSRASGFSTYNDPAVAIQVARRERPGLRVLYIDIDAHHADGVQEVFADTPDVLTISLHETGLHLFPGTGFPAESGYGDGAGFSANVPLPMMATDACYRLAFERVAEPLARAFAPDVIVAQLGVDAHHADPQTDLGLTLPGYREMVRRIVRLADDLCARRLVALGGGGYEIVDVVPRAWAWVMAELLGEELDERLPESWRTHVRELTCRDAPRDLGADDAFELPQAQAQAVLGETAEVVEQVRQAIFPHHGLTA